MNPEGVWLNSSVETVNQLDWQLLYTILVDLLGSSPVGPVLAGPTFGAGECGKLQSACVTCVHMVPAVRASLSNRSVERSFSVFMAINADVTKPLTGLPLAMALYYSPSTFVTSIGQVKPWLQLVCVRD